MGYSTFPLFLIWANRIRKMTVMQKQVAFGLYNKTICDGNHVLFGFFFFQLNTYIMLHFLFSLQEIEIQITEYYELDSIARGPTRF